MFNLSGRATRGATVFALGSLGAVMLTLHHRHPAQHPFSQELIHFLFACTSLPTISLLSAQLGMLRKRLESRKQELMQALERIQMLATRDELTGLYNRRHMMEALRVQRALAERTGQPFCVALIDLDHFKQINDTHGHGVGDEVLRGFAQVLQRGLRETDVVARWGGEEFLLLLNDTAPELANVGLERARALLTEAVLVPTLPQLKVTFSAGLTAYDTQKIKSIYFHVAGSDMAGKAAIMGALTLYLDFINMFQFLLSFLGNRE